jgi:hypothetical protein
VMMAQLAATQTGKVGFRAIRAGAVNTEAILMQGNRVNEYVTNG